MMDKAEMDLILGLAAHELGTTLTVLKSGIALLKNGDMDEEEEAEQLRELEAKADAMKELLDGIVALSTVDAGVWQDDEIIVQDTVDEVLLGLEHDALRKRLMMMTEGEDIAFKGSLWHFKRILATLLGNAIKFNEPEGEVVVSWYEEEGEDLGAFVLEVEDTGPGMSAEKMEGIFTRIGPSEGGMGVGLFFVREALSHMGGSISVELAEGGGCLFKVVLPFRR